MEGTELETLENVVENIKLCMRDGVNNRKSDFRTFTLCSGKEKISGRTVVLRGFDINKNIIIFHSNYTSDKINEIAENPKVCCVFYSKKNKLQIRCFGIAKINYKNNQTRTSWNKMNDMSKECYFQNPLPGTKLKNFDSFTTHSSNNESDHFSVITIEIDVIDWLYLKREGHRRAEIYLNDIKKSNWLSP